MKKSMSEIVEEADRYIELTLAEAKSLPDILGRLVYHGLKENLHYTCTIDGKKVFFSLIS